MAAVAVELRHALEPWHVMGEETFRPRARSVSSTPRSKRLQVLADGFNPERQRHHLQTAGPLPMTPTEVSMQAVAGGPLQGLEAGAAGPAPHPAGQTHR